jgi:DNA-binding protein YbaB
MFNKLKQIKDLKSQASQLKTALADEKAEGLSESVKITMNGNQEVIDVEILQEVIREKMQEDIKRATNDAIKKVQRLMAQKMQEMGGFNMPS